MFKYRFIFVLFFSFFSFFSERAEAFYTLEQKKENVLELEVQINTLLESRFTRTLMHSLIKEDVINHLLKQEEIVHFFSPRSFSAEKQRALLSLLLELNYSDVVVSTKGGKKNGYFYTLSAEIKNIKALIELMSEKLNDIYLLVRLEEVEKDRIYSIRAIKSLLEELNISQKTEFSVFALENEIKTLEILNFLDGYLQELVFDMDFSKSKQNELEYMKKYGKHTLSFSNALAEYYLFLDRPQSALDTLKEIESIQSYFSKYLIILTAMRRGEIKLAELDLEKMLEEINKENDLYAYFIVLKGALAQMKGLNAQMCQAYKLACTHGLCEAYDTVSEDCSWLEN